jgi:hypothetical protein
MSMIRTIYQFSRFNQNFQALTGRIPVYPGGSRRIQDIACGKPAGILLDQVENGFHRWSLLHENSPDSIRRPGHIDFSTRGGLLV